MFTLSAQFRPEIRSYKDNHVIAHADVCVKADDYSVLEHFEASQRGYKQACRFVRLIERGYSPDAAHWLSRYGQLNKHDFELEFDGSAHDTLTDEIPPFIPVDYAVEMFSIDELATCELNEIYREWKRDGGEAVFIASEYMSVDYNELRSYVTGRAQAEDEAQGNWSHAHHSDKVTY